MPLLPFLPRTHSAAWQFYRDEISGSRKAGPEAERELERWLGRNDLFYLLVMILRRPDLNHPWLFERCREVQSEPDGYLDLWAREHGKTSIISFGLTIQDILNDPEITVGIFSHTRRIAKALLQQIKLEFETNGDLIELYPDVLWRNPSRDAPRWSDDDGIIVRRKGNPKEATVEAWGLVDGQPTSKHFRLRIYDDTVTRESVATPDQIEKTTMAWSLSQNLGVTSDRGGAARYIGTRYALHDTYARMIEMGAVQERIHPATTTGRLDGHPVLFSDAEWEKRKREGLRATLAAQMLQNPMADEAAMFDPVWLRTYEVRPRTLNVYIMCDPSRGRHADSDNTAIAIIGISSTGVKYLIDGLRHRMTLSQRWTALRGFWRKWSRMAGVQHVAVGYERYGAQSDDEYFQEQMDRAKEWFPITELNWTREGGESKRERVERLEPDFRNARLLLPISVLHDNRPRSWKVDDDPDSRTFREVGFGDPRLTKRQMAAIEAGSLDLVAKAIKGVDQDQRVYDVTLGLIDEYVSFPFGRLKDLIDAVSRIYDMSPVTPIAPGANQAEPKAYFDS